MTPPKIATRPRGRLIAILITIALSQAMAAALAAFATRWLFVAMDEDAALPLLALAALVGSALFIASGRILFRRLGERLGQDYACDVRLALFDHASRMSPADLAARRAGYLTLRFVGDLTALKEWPARGLPMLVEGAVMAPAMVAILFVLDPGFGLIGLVLAVLSFVALLVGAPGLMRAHRAVRSRRALLAADMAERLPIAPELAALGRRTLELRLIKRRASQLTHAAQMRITRGEAMRALPDALSGVAAAALIWWGARIGLPTGSIAAGLAVLALTARPLRDLMGVADRAGAFRAAHAKLASALARPLATSHGPAGTARTTRLQSGALGLDVRDVDIGNGAVICLSVGPAGRADLPAGTDAARLFRAISGLEPVPSGEIRLNDVPIQQLSPGSLRRSVFRIDAHPIVLKGSLRRALTLGLSDRPDDKAILTRLGKAGLLGLLDKLGGLDRRLTEGARTLSAEARIEVSVLRAALGRPGLLQIADPELLCADVKSWLNAHPATVIRASTD
jgi:ABC-type multidrug transport system fused ATPase/permease subunit